MILYRAMCDEEYANISNHHPLSWNSRNKWFGTKEFVLNRVRDGSFNNSKFVSDRYKHIVQYEVESGHEHLINCGKNEYMLNVRKSPLVRIKIIGKIDF